MQVPVEEQSAAAPSTTNRRIVLWALVAIASASVIAAAAGYWNFNRPESRYLRGKEALLAGDYETVLRESEKLMNTDGHRSQGHLLRGLLLSRTGKPAEAITELEKAGSEQTALEACVTAAKCFYQLGQYLPAIEAARAALTRDTASIDARRWLAASYYDLGWTSDAVVELELISVSAPTDPRPDRLLGLIARDSEQYHRAVSYYRESLRRDSSQPDREKILEELSASLVDLKEFDEALKTLKDCRRTAFSLTLEADCRQALGQNDTAQSLLEQALVINPKFFPARLVQGKLLIDLGKPEQAASTLTEAIRIEPMNRQAHFQLSQALRQLGKLDEAEVELKRIQEIMALEREFTDLHETMMRLPMDAEVRFRTGELAQQLGKPELPKMWFRAALAIDPKHERARAALMKLNSPESRTPAAN